MIQFSFFWGERCYFQHILLVILLQVILKVEESIVYQLFNILCHELLCSNHWEAVDILRCNHCIKIILLVCRDARLT